jgi:hypothetical protein
MQDHSALLGTWKLVSWYNETATGARSYPLGEEAVGYITYTADGFVFVQMMAGSRSTYALNDPLGGTPSERAGAMETQITYGGTYADHGDHVRHHVRVASCPNWVGSEQIRYVSHRQIDGKGQLQLRALETVMQGEKVTAYLDWERAQ